MEFHDSNDSESEEEVLNLRKLDTLPPEIILHICSFLSAKFVINVFSRVCKTFQEVAECDTTWRLRIHRRWPKTYPLVPPTDTFDWKAACIEREEQYRLWSNHLLNMKKYHFVGAHYGSVNVVHLIEQGKKCLSGGRDGDLKVWNLDSEFLSSQQDNVNDVDISTCLMNSSHHGNAWLWDIAYDSSKKCIYTAGFDSNIKCWDLENPAQPITSFALSSPILCIAYDRQQLASGSFGRAVSIFDTRTYDGPVLKHILHKKPVLCIAIDDKHVISGSEDKSVIVYDKVAAKILQKLEFDLFPLKMSYGEGQLLVSAVKDVVHVINPRQAEFKLLHTFPTGHSKKVTGVQHSLGSVITCSSDQTIRIHEPNVNPEIIGVVESTNEVSGISFTNGILACANVDDSISVWVPAEITD